MVTEVGEILLDSTTGQPLMDTKLVPTPFMVLADGKETPIAIDALYDTIRTMHGGIKAVDRVYVGTPAATAKRPIIDDSYSVALTVLCRDVAAHDAYQVDPIHLAFVEKCKAMWTRVQIYDAE